LNNLFGKFKHVIIAHQSLPPSSTLMFRNYELQFLYERLRDNLTKVLHQRDKVIGVMDSMISKLQYTLKELYDQDVRVKYAALNKELISQGVASLNPSAQDNKRDISSESILDAILQMMPFGECFSRKMFVRMFAQRRFDAMCAEYGEFTAKIEYDEYCSSE